MKKGDLHHGHIGSTPWTLMHPCLETSDSPAVFFENFLTADMLLSICQESNKYAISKGHSLQVDVVELKGFIGILLVSGYVQLSRRRILWSLSDNCHNTAVANCMTKNRFEGILSYLHVADNNVLDMQDKFSKRRPLLDGLNRQ